MRKCFCFGKVANIKFVNTFQLSNLADRPDTTGLGAMVGFIKARASKVEVAEIGIAKLEVVEIEVAKVKITLI